MALSARAIVIGTVLALAASRPAAAQDPVPSSAPPDQGTSQTPAASPYPSSPGVGAVFGKVPGDLWRFVSVDTAIILGTGGAAAGVAHIWDDDLAGDHTRKESGIFAAGNVYGDFPAQLAIGAGSYITGRLADSPKLATTGADVMRAQILSQIYVQVLKYSTGRVRPDGSNDKSFPSGHAASSFATAAVFQRHYGWRAGVPLFGVAVYVAAARVHDHVHYLSDVVFGAAMGIASEHAIMVPSGRYDLHVVPVATPRRTQVTLVITPRTAGRR